MCSKFFFIAANTNVTLKFDKIYYVARLLNSISIKGLSMNDTKDQYKMSVEKIDNKTDIDYSSSSGIDSKRDSSDDNCSEVNVKTSTILSEQAIEMNGIKNTSSNPQDGGNADKREQTRFSVNNVNNDDEGKDRST
jgi:hypothetical protein